MNNESFIHQKDYEKKAKLKKIIQGKVLRTLDVHLSETTCLAILNSLNIERQVYIKCFNLSTDIDSKRLSQMLSTGYRLGVNKAVSRIYNHTIIGEVHYGYCQNNRVIQNARVNSDLAIVRQVIHTNKITPENKFIQSVETCLLVIRR